MLRGGGEGQNVNQPANRTSEEILGGRKTSETGASESLVGVEEERKFCGGSDGMENIIHVLQYFTIRPSIHPERERPHSSTFTPVRLWRCRWEWDRAMVSDLWIEIGESFALCCCIFWGERRVLIMRHSTELKVSTTRRSAHIMGRREKEFVVKCVNEKRKWCSAQLSLFFFCWLAVSSN